MDHLQRFTSEVRNRLVLILLIQTGAVFFVGWVAIVYLNVTLVLLLLLLSVTSVLTLIPLAWFSAIYIVRPVRLIWQAILHVSPDTANTPAPDLSYMIYGKELVTALISHVYQLASIVETIEKTASTKTRDLNSEFIANILPLPIVVLNKEMNVVFVNEALKTYIGRTDTDVEPVGQNVYLVLDMMFSNENTFDGWLSRIQGTNVTATNTWERIRVSLPEKRESRLCDLTAYYNKNNPDGFEIVLVLFDRTREYSRDDQAMSLVALAVHELRTPLTLLRGYIDVFEEELDGKLPVDMTTYLHKMKIAAQQLTAFTSNVLNVARFENNQLVLKLREVEWGKLLQSVVNDLQLRANLQGIKFTLNVDKDVPTVGADAVNIYEVVNNLLDNAIKYSGQGKEIAINAYVTQDGLVETTIKDRGVGIPSSAVGNLFDKFYRDYHNRDRIGGTGMGLYLSKAIITAHGGNIWVRSKEGEGTTFGFTLIPFSQLAEEKKKTDGSDITRTAHGWIKNHSMYRR